MAETLRFYRRNLPHWLVADATYFVTIRLHGTLPRSVVDELASEREQLYESKASHDKWREFERREFKRIERILDSSDNTRTWLKNEAVADLLLGNFSWLQGRGWRMYAIAIMSNHVHFLTRNFDGRSGELLADLGQFKSYTAREANKILGRKGTFWAREDFDHWLRSAAKFDMAVHYILNNPVKAGLVKHWRDWRWIHVEEGLEEIGDYKQPPRSGGCTG